MCPSCFAKGKELGQHLNNHKYEVRQSNFPLFTEEWSASEELSMLENLIDLGYGNWSQVSKQLQTKSSDECMQHYNEHYIDNPTDDLPHLKDRGYNFCYDEIAAGSLKSSDDPPRPLPNTEASIELAGYMPCRGDFEIEYDNFAETSIKDIELEDSDDGLMTELKMAALDIYCSRLNVRHYRKKIVRDYGLINMKRDLFVSYAKQERSIHESLKVFTRLQTAHQSEIFTQGVLLQSSWMKQISTLQEYRKAGLKQRKDGVIYKRLLKKRNEMKARGSILSEILYHIDVPISCQIWLQKQLQSNLTTKVVPGINMFPLLSRKPAAPLDLSGTPGLEQLADEEREMCSQLRLLPLQYLGHKNTLTKESQRLGSLKLQQARPLVKIDVNKTKKLYDFFIEKGWVLKGNE